MNENAVQLLKDLSTCADEEPNAVLVVFKNAVPDGKPVADDFLDTPKDNGRIQKCTSS